MLRGWPHIGLLAIVLHTLCRNSDSVRHMWVNRLVKKGLRATEESRVVIALELCIPGNPIQSLANHNSKAASCLESSLEEDIGLP